MSNRRTLWLLSLAAVALPLGWALARSGAGAQATVLARGEAGYAEDAVPARLVAWVRCALIRTGSMVQLQVELLAQGPAVDPVPGLAGIAGTNLRTAEELHRLLREGALTVESRPEAGGRQVGSIAAVVRGRLPTRRITPEGRLELDTATASELPVGVTLLTADLLPGRHHTYVVADGLPRLCVTTVHGSGQDVIEGIASIGEDVGAAPGRRP